MKEKNGFNDKNRQMPARRDIPPEEFLSLGKIPPQAVELEEVVLGAMMLEKDAVSVVSEILPDPEAFYKDAHIKIYEAILSLFRRSLPVDILTVTNELRSTGNLELVGGAYYVASLTNRVGSAANAEFHARVIFEKSLMRQVINLSAEILQTGFDNTSDVFDVLDKLQSKGYELASTGVKQDAVQVSSVVMKLLSDIDIRISETETVISGVPSGFHDVDKITNGWQPTDMIILAARPSMGKTAFALKCMMNAAIFHKKPMALFSLEMSTEQLVMRLISIISGVPGDVIKRKPDNYQITLIQQAAAAISEAPIYIDDTPSITIFEFRAKARRLKEKYGIEGILIDYVQLMTPGTDVKNIGTREQEISHISRQIKATAKELRIPVIALSQLSRSVEKREDKRPILSDLRESGSLEQDADLVAFLYRDEYYNQDGQDEEGNSNAGKAELIIRKHRNGSIGDVKLNFKAATANFTGIHESENTNTEFKPNKITPNTEPLKDWDTFDIPNKKGNDDEPF